MSVQPEPSSTSRTTCCGDHKTANKGKPDFVHACQLCAQSPTYWRNEPAAASRLAARKTVVS